jgi:hypothetical protein
MIGAATPVCAPLTPLPVRPSATASVACPKQTATALPASLDSGSDGGLSAWLWVAIGIAVALVAAAAVIALRRRRPRGQTPVV